MRNVDEISIGAASFSTFNHDRSMTTLNLERDQGNNKTLKPGSKLSNRSKLSNASRSVAGEGSSVNNVGHHTTSSLSRARSDQNEASQSKDDFFILLSGV